MASSPLGSSTPTAAERRCVRLISVTFNQNSPREQPGLSVPAYIFVST